MKPKFNNSDEQIREHIRNNYATSSMRDMTKAMRSGHKRFREIYVDMMNKGEIDPKKASIQSVTDDEIEAGIRKYHETMTRDQLLEEIGIGRHRYYVVLGAMMQNGFVMKRKNHPNGITKKPKMSDEEILKLWEAGVKRSEISKKVGLSEAAIRRRMSKFKVQAVKEESGEPWFIPRDSFGVMSKPWVSDKWINHNCRWLGA